jgi:hypothetical protein
MVGVNLPHPLSKSRMPRISSTFPRGSRPRISVKPTIGRQRSRISACAGPPPAENRRLVSLRSRIGRDRSRKDRYRSRKIRGEPPIRVSRSRIAACRGVGNVRRSSIALHSRPAGWGGWHPSRLKPRKAGRKAVAGRGRSRRSRNRSRIVRRCCLRARGRRLTALCEPQKGRWASIYSTTTRPSPNGVPRPTWTISAARKRGAKGARSPSTSTVPMKPPMFISVLCWTL